MYQWPGSYLLQYFRILGGNLLLLSISSQSISVMSTLAAKFLPLIITWLFQKKGAVECYWGAVVWM